MLRQCEPARIAINVGFMRITVELRTEPGYEMGVYHLTGLASTLTTTCLPILGPLRKVSVNSAP